MLAFKSGFGYLLSGFKLILKPGVKRFVIMPLLINTLLFAGVIVFGANLLGELISYLNTQWAWLEWLTWLLWPLFVVIALTIVFFCFSVVANLIGAPFNGFLSESVERHLRSSNSLDTVNRPISEEITLAFKSELHKFGYFAVRAIPLLILFLIPVLNISAPFVWVLFSAWMLSIEYMDYPLGNHGILFNQQRKNLFANKQLAFGFGLGVMLLTLIPVLNFLAMPVAVAGATRMYVERPELSKNSAE